MVMHFSTELVGSAQWAQINVCRFLSVLLFNCPHYQGSCQSERCVKGIIQLGMHVRASQARKRIPTTRREENIYECVQYFQLTSALALRRKCCVMSYAVKAAHFSFFVKNHSPSPSKTAVFARFAWNPRKIKIVCTNLSFYKGVASNSSWIEFCGEMLKAF